MVANNAHNSGGSYCNFPYSYKDTTGVGRALFDNGKWNAVEIEVFYMPSESVRSSVPSSINEEDLWYN
jgi:hypothetical protein